MRPIRLLSIVMLFLAACAAPAPQRDSKTIAGDIVAVIEAIEPVAEAMCRQHSRQLNCDFGIVIDDRPRMPPNAFQFIDQKDGGRPIVGFTISLLGEVHNRDELAFILAHEMAHHILGHLDRQRENAAAGAEDFARIAEMGGGSDAAVQLAQVLGARAGVRSYSQEFELEADALGTLIAHRAGFDPLLGAQFFFRIPDPGNVYLGSHPPNAARLAIVQQTAAGL